METTTGNEFLHHAEVTLELYGLLQKQQKNAGSLGRKVLQKLQSSLDTVWNEEGKRTTPGFLDSAS